MDKKTIVVVGAGQGLGNSVAMRFGREGFRVVLMARNGKSLKRYRQEFADEGIRSYSLHGRRSGNASAGNIYTAFN